jgi:hypothetical protein
MEEGDWIAMTGVPLTATEGETVADVEGGGADAQRGGAHVIEGVA